MTRFRAASILFLLVAAALPAQQDQPGSQIAVQDPAQRAGLIALAKDIVSAQTELAEARKNLAAEPDKRTALQHIHDLEARIQEQQQRFSELTVGLDPSNLVSPRVESAGDLQTEVARLLQPLLQKLKDATKEPREIEALRQHIATIEQDRLPAAQTAKARAAAELAALPAAMADADPADRDLVHVQLQRVLQDWTQTERRLDQQRTILRAELANKVGSKVSFWTAATQALQDFIRNRGLNLLLAVVACVAVFLGLRYVQRRIMQAQKSYKNRRFVLRLASVLLDVLVVAGSVGALMLTLYALGDWLLLGLATVFLVGAGWAVVRVMPRYFEQVRLVLNLGSVREGERIIWDGLPWRVETLRFQTFLVNPVLQGGMLRVPVADLVGKRSRPMPAEEPWFPCRRGDWVQLTDGTRGRVCIQTPDVVVLQSNGSDKSYPTLAFLAQAPRNLSTGFTVEVTFGFDPKYRPENLEAMPRELQQALERDLPAEVQEGQVKAITVAFLQASAIAIEVQARVELDGAAAGAARAIQQAVSRILIETSTAHGFGVPAPLETAQDRH
jgi:hypothetical protein